MLKKDPYIKFIEGTPSTTAIAFRDIPVTHHSDILEKLAGVRDLDNKIEITKKYITGMKDSEVCKDTLTEITNLFDKEAETYSVTNPAAAIECCLLLEEIQLLLQGERGKYTSRIETFVRDGINIPETISKINILDYRKQALGIVKKVSPKNGRKSSLLYFYERRKSLGIYCQRPHRRKQTKRRRSNYAQIIQSI